ncbi:DUF4328 domain-containing protein [Umezawaea beigongshangensis]|uniref:DUF4328 domain-containing protein n=1 Tax=Umezawaea beigongshangensis TaxID=2780383 RepID=UPI0018F21C0F|nr:DUF4328 domain-containing protein [Umezawaea beigongshangensis]
MRPQPPMRVDWVASPPPGAYQHRPAPRAPRYGGPPSYPAPPRWGFPLLAWRWPTSVLGSPDSPVDSVDRVRSLARTANSALGLTAVTALWAFGSEVWRYVLVAMSRYGALSASAVGVSDAMVVSSSVVTFVAAGVSAVLVLLWLRRARSVAALSAGYGPSRSDTAVVVGLLVPGMNLVVPGSVVAELEHAALRQPADRRPAPSRPVLVWWALWAASALLVLANVVASFFTSTQALANGIVLHALSDLVAAATAVAALLVVRRITTLILPVDTAALRFLRVLRVDDAPAPPLRASRTVPSPR